MVPLAQLEGEKSCTTLKAPLFKKEVLSRGNTYTRFTGNFLHNKKTLSQKWFFPCRTGSRPLSAVRRQLFEPLASNTTPASFFASKALETQKRGLQTKSGAALVTMTSGQCGGSPLSPLQTNLSLKRRPDKQIPESKRQRCAERSVEEGHWMAADERCFSNEVSMDVDSSFEDVLQVSSVTVKCINDLGSASNF